MGEEECVEEGNVRGTCNAKTQSIVRGSRKYVCGVGGKGGKEVAKKIT